MLTLIMSFIESAAMANGESICLTVTGKPHHQIPRKCVYTPPACPRNSMALLEPSCSPGNGFPSQQCGNCLLKQKDIASLGVIKPIKKNHLGLIYAVQNHMIDILWSAVSQTLGKARPAISSTSQWEIFVCCSCLYLSSQSDECFELLKEPGTPFQSALANDFDHDTE